MLPGEEKSRGREFTISFYAGDLNLNPLQSYSATEAQIYNALYEGLFTYHPVSLQPVPAVASRWDLSPDGKTYTFHLRGNARYWNGDRVTAEHFKNTWLTLLDPGQEAPYSFLFDIVKGAHDYRTGAETDPSTVGIEAVSDSVLKVELEKPAGHFLKILCHHSFAPLHPLLLEHDDWSSYASVLGNGPFYIFEQQDEEIILLKNELYWDSKNVKLSRLRMLFIDNQAEIVKRFNQGRIDWVADNVSLEEIQFKETIIINPLFATTYYYFATFDNALQNPAVRRALSLLLPWEELRSSDYHFIPSSTLVPQIGEYPEIEGITAANAEEARSLLEDAGFANGSGLPPIDIKIPAGGESRRVAGLMKENWERHLNVEIRIKTIGRGYYNSLKEQDYDIGTVTWIGDFADPLTFLQMWTSRSNLNDAAYNNEEFDALIDKSMDQKGEERYKTLADAEKLILDSGLVLPISHSPAVNLIDLNYIRGWYPNALDIHPYKYISFSDQDIVPNLVMYEQAEALSR